MILATVWFILIVVLIAGYAILDGFDLGVGSLHLRVARSDRERRLVLGSIAPVWDGNEVWLLTAGGALFAAFPAVYATVFSGFYLAMMLVLFALILRAVSIEFRSKSESPAWRRTFDVLFSIGSMLAAILLGVASGNLLRGIPIGADGEYAGTFPSLLNPYSVYMGILSLAMFATQGATYLLIKTEGDLADRARAWAWRSYVAFVALHLGGVAWSYAEAPRLFDRFSQSLPAWLPVLILVAAFVAFPTLLARRRYFGALLASSAAIAGQIAALGVACYPVLAYSSTSPSQSLSIENASSSQLTLKTMLVLAAIGVPIVLAYTTWVYTVFRGKTKLDEEAY